MLQVPINERLHLLRDCGKAFTSGPKPFLGDGENFLAFNGRRKSSRRGVVVLDVNTEFIVCHS